ncbi:ABC transporter ATP-binding protein [Nesterenkonia suensis]
MNITDKSADRKNLGVAVTLRSEQVSKSFVARNKATGRQKLLAVDDVSVTVAPGDFTAIVGESGSGKSTLARIMLGLMRPTEGQVLFGEKVVAEMSRKEELNFRSHVQCVLQDPMSALNPRKSVFQIIAEVVQLHDMARGRRAVREKVLEALALVDLNPPEVFADRFPHQLSGGQRQRVLIARAVVLRPSIIIADEAVSALDVSVKAGILNLLNELRENLSIGYLFITHDLPVVKKVADYVYVMKSGQVVEEAPTAQLFNAPETDYTSELLASMPLPDPRRAREWIRSATAVA